MPSHRPSRLSTPFGRHWIAVILGFLLPSVCLAEATRRQVNGTILQVAKETVYVDLGTGGGMEADQIFTVTRDGRSIGTIRILRVTRSFSACRRESGDVPFARGDIVQGVVIHIEQDPGETEEFLATDSVVTEEDTAVERADPDPVFRSTDFSGRLSFRHTRLHDMGDSDRDGRPSSALVSLEANEIHGGPLSLRLRIRSRHHKRSDGDAHPTIRLYDLSLRYESDRYAKAVGRLSPSRVAGVGVFDGAMVSGRLGALFKTGLFAGFLPDVSTSAMQTDRRRGGLFLSYESDSNSRVSQQAMLAFVGEYTGASIGREYLYVQHRTRVGRVLSLYQQAEVDVQRSSSSPNDPVQLSNVVAGIRFSPSRRVSFGAGYDARRFVPGLH